jgi:hypothetical protein
VQKKRQVVGDRTATRRLLPPHSPYTYLPSRRRGRQGRSEGSGGAKWIPGSPSSASSPSLPPSCIVPDLTVRMLTALLLSVVSRAL